MNLKNLGLVVSTLCFMGCGAVNSEPDESSYEEELVETEAQALTRACTSDLNCNAGCTCNMGTCGPDMFGPATPQSVCDTPPPNSSSPPDAFESDNSHKSASSYMGTPQRNHTFHVVGDVDWTLVATPTNQVMTVDAYNLRASTLGNYPMIRIEIYKYNYATRTLGALVGSTQSLICNYLTTSCFIFRATANVTAGSVYAVKIIDRRTGPLNDYDVSGPSYDLKMY